MTIYFLLSIVFFTLISFLYWRIKVNNQTKNKKLISFKKRFLSKEKNIEKIYLRDNEKKSLNPNINISIDIKDSEEKITRKVNIHRARLAKFKQSKLNGELLYLDENNKIYKYVSGEKIYLE